MMYTPHPWYREMIIRDMILEDLLTCLEKSIVVTKAERKSDFAIKGNT